MEEGDRERAGSVASDIKETAQTAGRAIGEQARAFATDVGHELSKKAEDQKSRGIEAIRGFAAAIDAAARELEQQSPEVARYVHDAAESLQGLSATVQGRKIDELMREASDVARSHPGMFFAGAVAAGFALSRFLKSSARQQESAAAAEEQWDTGGDGPYIGKAEGM